MLAETVPWDSEAGLEAAVRGGGGVLGTDGATGRGGGEKGDANDATGEGRGPEGLEAALEVGVELMEANTGSGGCECRWVCCCCCR